MTTIYETERLVVRPWTHDDVERHHDMYSRWEVVRWLGSSPRAVANLDESHESIERWSSRADAAGRFGIWAVERRDTGVVAGAVLLLPMALSGETEARQPEDGGDVEVGWHFHPDSWGNGFATESAGGAIAKGFAQGLEEIVAVVYPENAASLRVCERLGMSPTGRTDRWFGIELESFRITP